MQKRESDPFPLEVFGRKRGLFCPVDSDLEVDFISTQHDFYSVLKGGKGCDANGSSICMHE